MTINSPEPPGDGDVLCHVCGMSLNGTRQMSRHLQGKNHRNNVLRRRWRALCVKVLLLLDEARREPGGSQLAVPDGPQVPGGGQQMPQYAFEDNFEIVNPFPYDGGQQEPGGSQLAVPDGPQVPGGG